MAESKNQQSISASFSWPSGFTEEDIVNKILWKDTLCEITDIAGADNCFHLKRQEGNPQRLQLALSLKNGNAFETIIVLSEESLIEVHGNHEEYLFTVQGTLLDDIDGTLLFETRIDFPKPPTDVTLKFSKSRDALWIYGILAVTKLVEDKPKTKIALPFAPQGLEMLLSSMSLGRMPNTAPTGKEEDQNSTLLKQLEERLTRHIDLRIQQLENKIDQKFAMLLTLLSSQKEET